MDQIRDELVSGFRYESLKKAFLVSWIFIVTGLAAFLATVLVASLFRRGSLANGIVTNAGIFIFVNCILMASAGVHRVSGEGSGEKVRTVAIGLLKKAHLFLGITGGLAALFMALLLLQFGFTALAYIPYAGPVLVALLAGVFFLANVAVITAGLGGIALLPPLATESGSFRALLESLRELVRTRWLNVILYLLISLSVLLIAVTVLYYIIRYAMGITHAVQWKINATYPRPLSAMNLGSYVVDIVRRVTPLADPLGAYMAYGNRIFDYLNILKILIGISYAAVFSFIASFPAAVYFSVSSMFFNRLRNPAR